MDRSAQNSEFQMSDIIKKQEQERRMQERISWITQMAVPAVLITAVLLIGGSVFVEYLNDLSHAITNSGGDLK